MGARGKSEFPREEVICIPITKAKKTESLADLKAMVDGSQIVIFADYMGLNVAKISTLRADLKANGARLRVIKNTLARKAFEAQPELGIPVDFFKGPLAVIVGEDPVKTAKLLSEFIKDVEIGKVTGGVSEGSFIDAKVVAVFSKMPSKEENLARILGTLKAPLSKVHGQLKWPMQKLVLTVKAVGDKKAS